MNKTLKILFVCLSMSLLISTQIHADKEADLIGAVKTLYSAINSRDTNTFFQYMTDDGYTEFSYDGSPLFTVSKERIKRGFSTEFKADFKVDELKVKMLKDAAVVTGYRVGTLVRPDGTGHLFAALGG